MKIKNKNVILNEYKKKIKLLKSHNKSYFTDDSPKILDSDYDKLKKQILDLENKHSFILNKYSSINTIVGAPVTNKFEKIKHLKPMLSLSNAFDKNNMIDFIKKINNFLNHSSKNLEIFSEPKIDGISATLIYENGILTRGLSRGDGIFGENILENIKTIKSIPKIIKGKNIPNCWKLDVKFI